MKSNIVLLVIDSFRSDKFMEIANSSNTSNLNHLLKEGTYFSNAFSTADATLLSWSSIFTGNYPFRTGIRSSRFNKLDQDTTTLFHYLRKSNYSFFGFFPTFSEIIGLFPKFENENYLYDFTERLDTGLGEKILSNFSSLPKDKPWFFSIHLMDLHSPLIVPKNFDKDDYGFSKYEKIVSSIDFWIKKLTKKINLENTILIITADHGSYIKKIKVNSEVIDFEDDGEKDLVTKKFTKQTPRLLKPLKDKLFFSLENKKRSQKLKTLSKFNLKNHEKRNLLSGHFSTEHFLFDDSIHVPLFFAGKNIPKDKIFSKQVSLVDLLPSLLYLLDIDFDYSTCDGNNLFPLKSETVYNEFPAYIESNPLIDLKSNDVIGIRTSSFKYFRDKDSKNNRIHLYDLNTDPNENNNCASNNSKQVSIMEDILQKLLEKPSKNINDENNLSSDEIENELRKMGYV